MNQSFATTAQPATPFSPGPDPARGHPVRFPICALALALLLAAGAARAVDYHVATAQDLQNALTLAAANGANNTIYLTNGYYTGNFNYNSAAGYNLAVTNEPGVINTQITLDGAGGGRALSLTSSGTGTLTVAGITFSRNCGSTSIGALRIAGGTGSVILVNGCQFLSPNNTSGMGLELASGLNATITNCTATGATSGGVSTGILVSGLAGIVNVQNCTVVTNLGSANNGAGLTISSASVVNVANSSFAGNLCGVNVSGGAATLSGNLFTGNGYGGTYGSGGCVISVSGSVIVSNNNFTGNRDNNYTGGGGGAAIFGGTTIITGNNFTGNLGGCGGVSCGGAATITGNTFTGNSASSSAGGVFNGGGVSCSASATLIGNTFIGNSANGSGGGVYCGATAMLAGNTFTGNSSENAGGGLYCSGGSFIVSSNIFKQNAAAMGGGLYVTGPTVTLQDNLLANNSQTSASSQGGGIWVDATSTLFMINNTVTGNTAAGSGGGAAFEVTGTVELLNVYNNILWGNTANGNGGDVWLAGTGQKKIFDFNDVDSMYGVWDIAQNNKDVSPQFFDPVNGDYHIQSASPCKDAGTNGAPSVPATDLDGGPRIANGTVDLGCYEFSTAATHPADTNANLVLTPAEYAAYAAAWKSGQTWSNAPTVIPANFLTRAGYLMTNGGTYHNDGSARPVNWKTGP